MSYILNIGLARNDGAPNNTVAQVLQGMQYTGLVYCTGQLLQSDTEPTLVVEVENTSGEDVSYTVGQLAEMLGQDCIAVCELPAGPGCGLLAGPNADAWGEFNPEFFLLLDGSRLSSKAAV
jgi:hypothetical protein